MYDQLQSSPFVTLCVQVRISVVETYCERIRDLLDPTRDNLQVKQDASGAIFIKGAWLNLEIEYFDAAEQGQLHGRRTSYEPAGGCWSHAAG